MKLTLHENNAIVKDTKWEKEFPLKTFIGGPKPNWSKLQIQELKEFVNELNSEKDESKLNEMFVEKYTKLKVELNATSLKYFQPSSVSQCFQSFNP